jgi:hypothetical protein
VSNSNVNIDDDGDGGFYKNDHLRNLEQFLCNTSLTFVSDDPTSISEVLNRFIGNDFLEIPADQSDLYRI